MAISLAQAFTVGRGAAAVAIKNLAPGLDPAALMSAYRKNRGKTIRGWTPLGGSSRLFYNHRRGLVVSRRQYDQFIRPNAPKEKSLFEKKATRNRPPAAPVVAPTGSSAPSTYAEAREECRRLVGRTNYAEMGPTAERDWTVARLRGDAQKKNRAVISIVAPEAGPNAPLFRKVFRRLLQRMKNAGAESYYAQTWYYQAENDSIYFVPLTTTAQHISMPLPEMNDFMSGQAYATLYGDYELMRDASEYAPMLLVGVILGFHFKPGLRVPMPETDIVRRLREAGSRPARNRAR